MVTASTTAGNVQIRDATPDDRDAMIGLARASNDWEANFHPNRGTSHAHAVAMVDGLARWIAHNHGRVIVAEENGKVIGSSAFAKVRSGDAYLEDFDATYGYIAEVTVHDGHRGQGIGTALMTEAERWLAETGVNQIQIGVLYDNIDAKRLYERLGFRPYELALEKRLDGRSVPPVTGEAEIRGDTIR